MLLYYLETSTCKKIFYSISLSIESLKVDFISLVSQTRKLRLSIFDEDLTTSMSSYENNHFSFCLAFFWLLRCFSIFTAYDSIFHDPASSMMKEVICFGDHKTMTYNPTTQVTTERNESKLSVYMKAPHLTF